jgi:DNA-directed RNA polymerase
MPIVLAAANAMQRTSWRVNTRILSILYGLSEAGVHTDEIVSTHDKPKPPPPAWLTPGMTKEQMTKEQDNQFHAWKRVMAEWYTEKKLSGTKFARFYAATRAAEMFKEYPALHFVYFADSRGRFYPMTYGVNPQGSDMQKALLTFGVGKPLHTEDALRWFHIQGANKYGFDKATLPERFMFAHDRREEWLHYAADPINNRGWLEADSPLQFLAWCLEYADWVQNPETFLSHLPISMDGSCNGLQNLSAMLRDEVGGKATNLTDNEVMEDIYRRVAEASVIRLQSSLSGLSSLSSTNCRSAKALAEQWLLHGVSRTVVKRSVMTTPYGVTMRSATDYVVEDYLKRTSTHGFERTEYRAAAQVLMAAVWPAIGDVVVKGRQAMDWLRKSARAIVKDNKGKPDEEPIIWWTSPSGFPASQAYFEAEVHRINTRLLGTEKIRVLSETEEADVNKHSSGLAPNFVHSMDAAHLHLVAAASGCSMIDHLAMIHDDYGTHAADAQKLFDLIREQFVWMYETHDPVNEFHNKYPCTPKPPSKGNLDIREVLQSKFFFS